MRPRTIPLLALLLCVSGCTTGETIRVRDHDEVLLAGRIRKTAKLSHSERHHVAIGAEVGAYGTNGQYGSPAGPRDYRHTVGYGAFVADIGIGNFTILPKIGVGLVDFAVAGQTTTVGDDGLGALFGVEGRYRITRSLDMFGRATSFHRSSLASSMIEAGFGFHVSANVLAELGYGKAAAVIDDASDIFNNNDEADVETQGLLLSMTLRF